MSFEMVCLNNNFKQRKTIKISKRFSYVPEIHVSSEIKVYRITKKKGCILDRKY